MTILKCLWEVNWWQGDKVLRNIQAFLISSSHTPTVRSPNTNSKVKIGLSTAVSPTHYTTISNCLQCSLTSGRLHGTPSKSMIYGATLLEEGKKKSNLQIHGNSPTQKKKTFWNSVYEKWLQYSTCKLNLSD